MEDMNIREAQTAVQQELARHHDAMIQFLRDLVAIPSFDSQIGPVGDAVGARMSDLGFDECYGHVEEAGPGQGLDALLFWQHGGVVRRHLWQCACRA